MLFKSLQLSKHDPHAGHGMQYAREELRIDGFVTLGSELLYAYNAEASSSTKIENELGLP